MIERCGTFDNLDSWLAEDETIKKYKKEVLSKIIDLPPDEVKPQQQQNLQVNSGVYRGGNPDLFGGMPFQNRPGGSS